MIMVLDNIYSYLCIYYALFWFGTISHITKRKKQPSKSVAFSEGSTHQHSTLLNLTLSTGYLIFCNGVYVPKNTSPS